MRPAPDRDLRESRLEEQQVTGKASGIPHRNGCRTCTVHGTVSRGHREELNHAACREWMGQEIAVLGKQLDTERQLSWSFSRMGP